MKSEVRYEYTTECGNCRHVVSPSDSFCENCGAELVWRGCVDCALIPLNQSASFCYRCGKKLIRVTQHFVQEDRVLQPYTGADER